ncbi:hypothetical protein OPV22_006316 [Ensete ventricosum]|uniref:Uncharacterized protein n=1 Tax=Ensete ventricosum TaxID=4639 RepID=A0AAV8RR03_ENSVE|nr:hypothetical protein OPV22_006316 [Ensete ventricosum]
MVAPLESIGVAEISGGVDGGGVATMVLLLGDEATVDDGTGGLRGGRLEVEGDLTHPLSGEGEHGDGREVAVDTEADGRRGLGEGAKSEEARGGDAAARRDATSYVASTVGAEDDRCVAKPTRLGHQVCIGGGATVGGEGVAVTVER